MPSATCVLLKSQKPVLSLKQFMLRSEVLKLYRGFMRLGRFIEAPPTTSSTPSSSPGSPSSGAHCDNQVNRKLNPLQLEWIDWVRAEFRLRQQTTDEESVKMMLAHGKRQLQEMERTISLATNKNLIDSVSSSSVSSTSSSCSQRKEK